jgi:NAD(P)-dependent dehydrogenase (short-subunit alcohol dehydrogenase family)
MSKKAWLITGATRGLGLALARWVANKGYVVYGCGSQASTVAQAQAQLGHPHRIEQVDISDAEAVSAWVNKIFNSAGPHPEWIVNNAAIITPNAPLWQVSADDFSRLLAINISGSFHVIRACVPYLQQQSGGVIVNFSSGWGRSVSPEVAPYCASKWAIEGMTHALAEDLPDTIATYALNPGIIDTAMLRSCFEEGAASCIKPEQWAEEAGPLIEKLPRKQAKVAISV